jgi:ribosome-binding factor A
MRSLLASKMEVKHTPQIHYHYNSQFEDESKITQLLKDNDEPSNGEE